MSRPRIGAQLFSVREFTRTIPDIERTFKRVADIGYTEVQISGFGPVDPKEVAKVVRDSGLKVAATHMAWARFLENPDAVIEEHRLWGCRHAAIGSLPGSYFTAEGVGRFVAELTPVAARLAEAGMDFSYHNHNHELARFGSRTWLDMLYDAAPADVLKAELDTYWIQAGGGDPAQWIRKCSGREPVLHLKDMTITPDRQQRFAPVGEGNLNWPAILSEAGKGGVRHLLVEQDDCYGRDQFDALASSYRFLSGMGYD